MWQKLGLPVLSVGTQTTHVGILKAHDLTYTFYNVRDVVWCSSITKGSPGVTPSMEVTPNESLKKFCGRIYKNTAQMVTGKDEDGGGGRWLKSQHFWGRWLKKVITFWSKITIVTAPVDTNLSDTTGVVTVVEVGNVTTLWLQISWDMR